MDAVQRSIDEASNAASPVIELTPSWEIPRNRREERTLLPRWELTSAEIEPSAPITDPSLRCVAKPTAQWIQQWLSAQESSRQREDPRDERREAGTPQTSSEPAGNETNSRERPSQR